MDLTKKKYLMYPLEAQTISTDVTDISLYGICVDKCPSKLSSLGPANYSSPCDCLSSKPGFFTRCPSTSVRETKSGTWIRTKVPKADGTWATWDDDSSHNCNCEHDGGKCWDTSYPTKSVLYRCIPCENPDADDCQPVVSYTTQCTTRNGNTVKVYLNEKRTCKDEDGDGVDEYTYHLSTQRLQEAGDNQIGDMMSGFYALFTQHLVSPPRGLGKEREAGSPHPPRLPAPAAPKAERGSGPRVRTPPAS